MDRIIVGSGRCGSTLLSRMLAENPDTLSVFEHFNGLDVGTRFAADPATGGAFAQLISAEQPFVTAVLRRGYQVAEITYPFGPSARYRRGTPLPWILVSMLPRLSDTPDELFDEVIAFAHSLRPAPMIEHHRALFEWLVVRFDRKFWIERSGSSIDYLAELDEQFPAARFLHIHRDGREAALSMREHHAYRLPISLMYGAPADGGIPLAELGPLDLHAEPTDDDPISQVLKSRPSAHYFGQYWNDQILRGHEARAAIARDRYQEVWFEDLVADPRVELLKISEFFEIDPSRGGWLERAIELVRGVPPSRLQDLSDNEAKALLDVVRPGCAVLGRDV
ncbi:MAG: hypothetical protein AAEJ52_03655 [Myxococcota bacterium]